MNIIQVIIGYVVIFSIFNLLLSNFPFLVIVCLFVVTISLLKVIPHPDSHLNPFAFGIRSRKRR